MARIRPFAAACLGFVACVVAVSARQAPPSPPAAADAAVTRGMGLFRERCAECHGADGKGVAGHDLTRLWTAGATDAQVFAAIRGGVPNTIMPSSTAPDDDIRAVIAYLRSLTTTTAPAAAANAADAAAPGGGNAAAGEQTFAKMCAGCHTLNGRGGRLGPDLSRAGGQPREQLVRAIRTASASFANGYQPVTIVTRDGRRIRAARKSEDAFSIQVMDTQERLQGYLKADVREIVSEKVSLMPDFGPDRLSDRDLDDLLRFLSAAAPAAPRR